MQANVETETNQEGLFIGKTELGVLLGVASTILDRRTALARELKNRGWKRDPLPVLCANGAAVVSSYTHIWTPDTGADIAAEDQHEIAASVAFTLTQIMTSMMAVYWGVMRGRNEGIPTTMLPTYTRAMILRRIVMEGRGIEDAGARPMERGATQAPKEE